MSVARRARARGAGVACLRGVGAPGIGAYRRAGLARASAALQRRACWPGGLAWSARAPWRAFSAEFGSSRPPVWAASTEEPDDEEFLRRYEDFRRTLHEPNDIWVDELEARKKFALSRDDLIKVDYIVKESPYDAGEEPFRQYPLKEVVQLAKRKHGEEQLLNHFRYYSRKTVNSDLSMKVYGNFRGEEEETGSGKSKMPGKRYWYNAPSTSTTEGRESVLQGLRANVAICAAKGGVWLYTGSHVMFADWMHSIADVANYSYRLIELNSSARHRDVWHPYGYAPLRYITADRSFVFLFFVGGVCPLLSGLWELVEHKGHVALGEHLFAPAAVFVISVVLESVAIRTAYGEILSLSEKEQAKKLSSHSLDSAGALLPSGLQKVLGYLREGRDVMSTATFSEASSGVLGAGIGLLGLAASWGLQSGTPDVVASVVMASMVCGISTFLLRKSGKALLGQTLPSWRVQALVLQLEAHAAVVNVYDVKTELVGTDTVRFKAEVQFNAQAITERILRGSSAGGKPHGAGLTQATAPAELAACPDARLAHAVLAERMREILPQLHRGLSAPADLAGEAHGDAAAWLYRNNGLFYEALAWELKDVERMLRHELRDFRNVHIDLEPW